MDSAGVAFQCQVDIREIKSPKQDTRRATEQTDFYGGSWQSNNSWRMSNPGRNLQLLRAATAPPGSPSTAFISQGSTSLISPDIQALWLNIKFLSPKYVNQYVITHYHSSIISWHPSLFRFVSLLS